jgi:hypothetical protein
VRLNEIIELTEAKRVAGNKTNNPDIQKGFSSDLMSDVLTLDEHNIVLITGLSNVQLVRTAEMADIEVVLLARNKIASEEMLELANENGLIILQSPYSIFRASGILYKNGLNPVY